MNNSPLALLALVAACSWMAVARAETVNLGASKDNTLYEPVISGEDVIIFSNGSGSHFFAGTTAAPDLRRGLLAFDLAGQLPAGAQITSVSLRLNMSRTISGATDVSLHRVLADWGEGESTASGNEGGGTVPEPGDATWINRFHPGNPWTTEGGDFVATASAVQSVSGLGFYTWASTPELVADVQNWVDDPATNFGWALIGDEQATGSAKRFDSRNHISEEVRPVLTIDFTAGAVSTADFDDDGDVDGDDFLVWQRGVGTLGTGTLTTGDANSDGNIDALDLDVWEAQFGTTPPALDAVSAVPEPAAGSVLALAAAMLAGRSRRRRWRGAALRCGGPP
jgi:hypothetical protein